MSGAEKAPLTANPTQGDRDNLYSLLGRPETPDQYELPVDGNIITEDIAAQYADAAHNLRLTPEQAQGVLEFYKNNAMQGAETMQQNAEQQAQQVAAELQKEWGDFFGNDFEAFYSELQNNEVGQHTQLMAYSKLMDYQPTDVIANPQAYMEGGNWRMLHMLKTFQLRQANRVYSELKKGLQQAKAGDTKAAFETGVKLASFIVLFGLAGATKDELRDLILGRELPARDHFWNNLMQLAMFSRYDVREAQQEGWGKMLLGNLQPPTPYIDLPMKTLESFMKGETPDIKLLTMMPIIGKPVYARYTEQGREATVNQTKRGYAGLVRRAVRSEDSTALTKARADIRAYNSRVTGDTRITTSAIARWISEERKKLREAR